MKKMMTIEELITELNKYPPETVVLVDGYEQGYDDIDFTLVPDITQDLEHANYEGRYCKVSDLWEEDVLKYVTMTKPFTALVLQRGSDM